MSDGKKVDEKKADEKETSTFMQVRDIFESLAIALFLAFLFKTFEAEAFVIPTGSMAPTLMGRHKDVECSQCNYRFQTSASEEIDAANNRRSGLRVVAGVCPQCGFVLYFGDEKPGLKNDKIAPSFTGDRILVSKMTFDHREPARWDVSVFRSPGDPKINFIKRVVGLPNENLRVQYGDLFVQAIDPSDSPKPVRLTERSDSATSRTDTWAPDVNLAETNIERNSSGESWVDPTKPFEIARKEYKYLRQILQVVYDNDYPAPTLQQAGWPERWTDDLANQGVGKTAWRRVESKNGCGFSFTGELDEELEKASKLKLGSEADVSPVVSEDEQLFWLRYRHIIPSSKDWFYLVDGKLPPDVEATGVVSNNPRLIDDFAAYNAGVSRRQASQSVVGSQGSRVSKYVEEWDRSSTDEYSQLSQVTVAPDGSSRIFVSKNPDGFGCNWVGDLAISCDLAFDQTRTEDSGVVAFDLVKGGIVFRCSVAPKAGTIALSVPAVPEYEPKTITYDFTKQSNYQFVFLNVDEEMRVVINDKELVFPEDGGRYDALTRADGAQEALIPRNRDPNARDLAPVAIGARNVSVRIESLKVLRDVYYIAAGRMLEDWDSGRFNDFNTARCDRLTAGEFVYLGDEDATSTFMSSPELWKGYGNTKSALLTQHEEQYVAFGDNSGFSLDSRLWADGVSVPHYVDRKYLIGKAFYVYWPHGWPLPVIKSPFWPNFAKMRHID